MTALKYILVIATGLFSSVNCQNIDPPQGNTEFFKAHGSGTINYVCKDGKFVLSDAEGSLQDQFEMSINIGDFSYTSMTAATFSVGGNSIAVLSTESATSPSSNPNSLPNALFSVIGETCPGNLEGVTFVQRTDTQSGLAPGPYCSEGSISKVVFSATYRFFKHLPDSRNKILPPNSSVFLMSTQGVGIFNYVCKNNLWAYVDLTGDLFPIGNTYTKIGTFSISPTPDANGGQHVFTIGTSSVMFKSYTSASTENPDIIPEVLYSTTSTTPGKLGNVKFGQRLNPFIGKKPSNPCNEGHASVPFRAQYVFYI